MDFFKALATKEATEEIYMVKTINGQLTKQESMNIEDKFVNHY